MSKHIYRNVIIALSLVCASAQAQETDTQEIVNSIIQKYRNSTGNETPEKVAKNKSIDKVLENTQNNAQNSTDYKKMFLENAMIAKSLGNKSVADKLEDIALNTSRYTKKIPTVFYFYSESMPPVALERFYGNLKKLTNQFPEDGLQGFAVFRGMPADLKNFSAKYNKDAVSGGKFKFHPLMYRFYGLNSVPAFAFAYCPQEFSFRGCEGHMLVRGDVSIEEALKIFAEENKTLLPYYDFLALPK